MEDFSYPVTKARLSAIEQLAGLYFPPLYYGRTPYFAEARDKKKQRHASPEAFSSPRPCPSLPRSFSIVLMTIVITGDALEWIA